MPSSVFKTSLTITALTLSLTVRADDCRILNPIDLGKLGFASVAFEDAVFDKAPALHTAVVNPRFVLRFFQLSSRGYPTMAYGAEISVMGSHETIGFPMNIPMDSKGGLLCANSMIAPSFLSKKAGHHLT